MEFTEFWDVFQRLAVTAADNVETDALAIKATQLLDEIRLAPETYRLIVRDTVLRHLALTEAVRRRWNVEEELVARNLQEFRRAQGLESDCGFNEWLQSNGTDLVKFTEVMREAVIEDTVCNGLFPGLFAQLRSVLWPTGDLRNWVERADDKRRFLEYHGLSDPDLQTVGLNEEALVEWYTRTELGGARRVN